MLLNWVGIRYAVGNIGHAMEVKGTDEESFDESGNLDIVVEVVSAGIGSDKSGSESDLEHCVFDKQKC